MRTKSISQRLQLFCARVILFHFALLFSVFCPAQKTTGDVYLFKQDGSQTGDAKEAAFLMHVFQLNDSTYLSRYYQFGGPIVRQESYSDSDLTIPNGRFCWYNEKGRIDSTGLVNKGKKDGTWRYTTIPNQTRIVTYENGKKVKEDIYLYDKKGNLINRDTTNDKDSVEHILVTAKFKNGIEDWRDYCKNNLHTPKRLQDVLGIGTHASKIYFLVNKEGKTEDIYLTESCEWSGDAEAMRLIADSPLWQPATKDGQPIIYAQLQQLSYQVLGY